MKYKIQVYSIWEDGQRKDAAGNPHQEDSIFPAFGKQTDSDRLFILCDGMGGHDAGEVASATVCDAMSKSVLSHADADSNFSDAMFQEALDAAFDALDTKDTGALKKMGTTMTFLKLHSKGATIAHMGDSRVYHIRQGEDKQSTKILFVTRDHSLVNDQIKLGEITPEQAKTSPQKNVITRAMQPHMERRPKADIHHTVDIRPGDYFFMCSDGMLEQMEDEYVPYYFSKAAGDDEEKVRRLIQSTKDNRDNHSAIIVHILDVEDPLPVPKKTESMGSNVGEVTDDADDVDDVDLPEMVPVADSRPVTAEPIPNDPLNRQPQPKKRSSLWSLILGVFVLIVIIVFAVKQFSPTNDNRRDPVSTPVEKPTPSRQQVVNSTIESASEEADDDDDDIRPSRWNGSRSIDEPSAPQKSAAKPGKQAQQPATGNPQKEQQAAPGKTANGGKSDDAQATTQHQPQATTPSNKTSHESMLEGYKTNKETADAQSAEQKARDAASKSHKGKKK